VIDGTELICVDLLAVPVVAIVVVAARHRENKLGLGSDFRSLQAWTTTARGRAEQVGTYVMNSSPLTFIAHPLPDPG